MIDTEQAVMLDLFVDRAQWEGLFDKLEVFRSHGLAAGPYEALTDDAWMPARITEVRGEPSAELGPELNLSGRTLKLRVNELIDIVVTFAGADPYTFARAAEEITAVSLGLLRSFVLATGTLVVETMGAGLGVALQVVEGDAAPLLGLPLTEPGSLGRGRDARIPLLLGQSRYMFLDPHGGPDCFYKTRFFNSHTRLKSDYSAAFVAPSIARLGAALLVQGVVNLVDASGVPIANRTVLVFLGVQASPVDKRTIVGGTTRMTTDMKGHAEFVLIRGTTITVSVAGTDLSRKIKVPSDPALSSFDLLDPAYGNDDLFAVQRPNLPFAARRAL